MLGSINGVGRTLYGRRDFDADGSYITTRWLIFVFFPISPAESLRVINHGFGSYEVLEELPVCWPQVLLTYAYVYALLPVIFHFADKFKFGHSATLISLASWAALPTILHFFAKKKAGL